MPINFDQAKQDLKTAIFEQRGAGGGAVFAREFANWYDRTVRRGGDASYNNAVLSPNLPALQSSLTAGLSAPAPRTVFQQALATGIPLYWTGATLAFTAPPPGSFAITGNVVVNPGTLTYTLPDPTDTVDVFVNTVVASIRQHLLTLSGITTALVPTSGGPVPAAFPWTGYR